MREIRKSGSEGGKPYGFPTPIKLTRDTLKDSKRQILNKSRIAAFRFSFFHLP